VQTKPLRKKWRQIVDRHTALTPPAADAIAQKLLTDEEGLVLKDLRELVYGFLLETGRQPPDVQLFM
jgi:hypothetical protein